MFSPVSFDTPDERKNGSTTARRVTNARITTEHRYVHIDTLDKLHAADYLRSLTSLMSVSILSSSAARRASTSPPDARDRCIDGANPDALPDPERRGE